MKTHFSNLTRFGVTPLCVLAAFSGSVVAAPLNRLRISQPGGDSVQASEGQSPVLKVQSLGMGGQVGMGASADGGDPPANYGPYGGYTFRSPALGERSYFLGAPAGGLCWRGGHDDGTGRGWYFDCQARF
jgi:hypothetical protein